MRILVTGAAGFIGSHQIASLLKRIPSSSSNIDLIFGLDNLNHFYSPELKKHRIELLKQTQTPHYFEFTELDLLDQNSLTVYLNRIKPEIVIHLAAQAGVSYSFYNPKTYIENNIVAFTTLLDTLRLNKQIPYIIYASSSSVYGDNTEKGRDLSNPFDQLSPLNVYAATKVATDALARAYSIAYGFWMIGLRFYTVYGPLGRPDMLSWLAIKALREGEALQINSNAETPIYRDFTYIDDVTASIQAIIDTARKRKVWGDHRTYDIAHGVPVSICDFVRELARQYNPSLPCNFRYFAKNPNEATLTRGSPALFEMEFDIKCKTDHYKGIEEYVKWLKSLKDIDYARFS